MSYDPNAEGVSDFVTLSTPWIITHPDGMSLEIVEIIVA